jgi:hypothetical protein
MEGSLDPWGAGDQLPEAEEFVHPMEGLMQRDFDVLLEVKLQRAQLVELLCIPPRRFRFLTSRLGRGMRGHAR